MHGLNVLLGAVALAAAVLTAEASDDASAPSPPPPGQQQQPVMCPRELYLPASSLLSRGARSWLEAVRPPPGGLAASRVPSADEARRQRAHDAGGWRPQSERYKAAYMAADELVSLGGVTTVRAEPKPGLAADGQQLSASRASAGGGGMDRTSALLFLHGGGYRGGDPRVMFFAFAPLAAAAGLPAYAPDYRLAPEHPYPAALDDVLSAYKALIKRVPPARVALAGDSAGGGLAAALLLRAAAERLPLPGAAVLFSPWALLRGGTDTSVTLRCADPVLSPDGLAAGGRMYAGAAGVDDPLVSPALADWGAARAAAEAFGGTLPPVLITCGTREVLLGDAVRLRQRMRDGGVDATISPYEGMWHSFNSRASPGPLDIPEAAAVIAEAAEFIRRHMPRAAATDGAAAAAPPAGAAVSGVGGGQGGDGASGQAGGGSEDSDSGVQGSAAAAASDAGVGFGANSSTRATGVVGGANLDSSRASDSSTSGGLPHKATPHPENGAG